MHCTVLRSKTVSCELSDKQHHPPIVNYMPTALQWAIQNSTLIGTPVDCFFSRFLRAQNMLRVIEGKII